MGYCTHFMYFFIVCPPDHVTANVGATRASQCYSTNQCALGQDDCSWNANCIDLPDVNDIPAYKCSCKPGFKGNGTVCIGELFMIGQLDYLTLKHTQNEIISAFCCLSEPLFMHFRYKWEKSIGTWEYRRSIGRYVWDIKRLLENI